MIEFFHQGIEAYLNGEENLYDSADNLGAGTKAWIAGYEYAKQMTDVYELHLLTLGV